MIQGIHGEVVLVAAYAAFLVAAAALLEWIARQSHQRVDRYQTSGFVYFQQFDHWECPMGERLTRSELDDVRRIVRYRAPARACNACSLKNNCTDSDQGRALERHMDSWLQSELRRFHRVFSATLLFLSIVLLLAGSLRHPQPRELALLAGLLVPVVIVEIRCVLSLRAAVPDSPGARTSTPAEW
jgi:hypothetical protein